MYTQTISPVSLRELIAGLALVGLPHWLNAPFGPMAFFYLMLLYRFLAVSQPRLLPRKAMLLLMTLAGFVIVGLQANGVFGKTAGSSLLMAGTGLKLLELRGQRDLYIVTALAYLLALTQFLFSQAIPMALYLLAMVTLLTAALIGTHCGTQVPSFLLRLRHSALLAAQALPLAVLLFLLAPRIPGPLWSLPEENTATTGLSDNLEPGSISQLGLSDALAFRVNFIGLPPAQNQLYWRGLVFWWTDGRRWERRVLPTLDTAEAYFGKPLDYTIVLEPHGHKWLLALDLPQKIPVNSHLTADFQVIAKDDVHDRRLYALRSYPGYHALKLNELERKLGLQLPKKQPMSLQNLVASWRQVRDDDNVVQQALAYFYDNDFFYTLHPPALPDRPVERFLLETRRGFCEHYATAFVVLMRLAGIPARVVTGYQGGHWNDVGQFLEVKQSDAHAWAEVWLENRGWLRVDPTAAVAPERVEKPVEATSADTNTDIDLLPAWRRQTSWLKPLRFFWASIDHGWHRRVLGYDQNSREQLLQWLGAGHWPSLTLWLLVGLTGSAMPFLWLFWRDKRSRTEDPALQCYRRFCAKLAAKGFPHRPNEGPMAYAQRVATELPTLAGQIHEITDVYIRLRYGEGLFPGLLQVLRRKVRQLS